MNLPCGCCEGTEVLTPMTTANRPGLPALSYRVGTHATFLETMKARLASALFPELADLKTRNSSDPSIAMLDAWALVGDVLTFYEERIANEGYLGTATERRSILELASLIGYALRPGVASTVYLAYTLDEDRSVTPPKPTAVTIAKGSRAQSVPGPGELPQSFETSDKLEARSEWNNLQVRLTQPQTKESIENKSEKDPDEAGPRVYLKGVSTNLKQNDPLLIDFGGTQALYRVRAVEPNADADRTLVRLQEWMSQATTVSLVANVSEIVARYRGELKTLGLGRVAIVKRVTEQLNDLEKGLTTEQPVAALATHIERVTITNVTDELPKAEKHVRQQDLMRLLKKLLGDLHIAIQPFSATARIAAVKMGAPSASVISTDQLLLPLLKPPSLPPASAVRLGRDVNTTFTKEADTRLQLLGSFRPTLSNVLASALANAKVTEDSGIKVYALRLKAPLFGHNAPLKPKQLNEKTKVMETEEWATSDIKSNEEKTALHLDAGYDKVLPSDWIVVDTSAVPGTDDVKPAEPPLLIAKAVRPNASISRAAYGMSGSTTRIDLGNPSDPSKLKPWIRYDTRSRPGMAVVVDPILSSFQIIRRTVIFTQSEELPLADEPIIEPICGGKITPIELNSLYNGLDSGRWLVVCGERVIEGTSGVKVSELLMLAGVQQTFNKNLPGDKTHSFIRLAEDLAYCYKRDTMKIYGNVVKASHGETRKETLGAGDGSKAFQEFTLKQPPLTFVSASNPSGTESTLVVRVNDVQWHETDSLAALLPNERKFVTHTDDDGKTTVIFGNGRQGARLPTGQENLKAGYRNGIGKPGNVKADQITLLATRPLGVKEVTNPLPASGGAGKENRDQARQNAPLTVTALDRLVSTQDYADFARTFAGIGKASAVRLSDGRRNLVHVTIAGNDDIPIDEHFDLFTNLTKALRQFGDPYLPIKVGLRKLKLLVIQAKVRVLPDYLWEKVEPKVRAALLDIFSFARRDLGQDALLSEALSAIQAVEGVKFVDVDKFDGVEEQQVVDALANKGHKSLADQIVLQPRVRVTPAHVDLTASEPDERIQPAELAYFSPDVPDTIILSEITA